MSRFNWKQMSHKHWRQNTLAQLYLMLDSHIFSSIKKSEERKYIPSKVSLKNVALVLVDHLRKRSDLNKYIASGINTYVCFGNKARRSVGLRFCSCMYRHALDLQRGTILRRITYWLWWLIHYTDMLQFETGFNCIYLEPCNIL